NVGAVTRLTRTRGRLRREVTILLSFWKTALGFVVVALTVPLFAGVLRSAHQPVAPRAVVANLVAHAGHPDSVGEIPRPIPTPAPTPKPAPKPAPVHVAAAPAAPVAQRPVVRAPAPAPRPAPPPRRPGPPPIVVGSFQQSLINGDRARAGLGAL